MIQKTIKDLKKDADQRGLSVPSPGFFKNGNPKKPGKREYLRALAAHEMTQRFGSPQEAPPALKFRLTMESPQLAYQYTKLNQGEQTAIWEDPKWVLTEKENGIRGVLIYDPSRGLSVYSRNISITDFLPVDFSPQLLRSIPAGAMSFPWAVDVEIKATNPNLQSALMAKKNLQTETELQAVQVILSLNTEESHEIQRAMEEESGEPLLEFKLIDVLFWEGRDLRDQPYKERFALHPVAVSRIAATGLNIRKIMSVSGTSEEKRAFHEAILARGGEGTVAAYADAPYRTDGNRQRDHWVKIKRSVAGAASQAGMADSIDGWISGFEEATEDKGNAGMVGSLIVSCLLNKSDGTQVEHEIAKVSGIPLSLRQEITVTADDGSVALKEEFYGKVVEIDGQAISPRNLRLTHARIIGFRPDGDKSKFECEYSEEWLRAQVM